jgi:hypothetical protein
MMKDKYLFPRKAYINERAETYDGPSNGITLREWYAGLAMQGMITHSGLGIDTPKQIIDVSAFVASRMADALIAALNAGEE